MKYYFSFDFFFEPLKIIKTIMSSQSVPKHGKPGLPIYGVDNFSSNSVITYIYFSFELSQT